MELCKQTAFMPLSSHQMLSDDCNIQESVFGDTVKVRVDLASGEYEVEGMASGNGRGTMGAE